MDHFCDWCPKVDFDSNSYVKYYQKWPKICPKSIFYKITPKSFIRNLSVQNGVLDQFYRFWSLFSHFKANSDLHKIFGEILQKSWFCLIFRPDFPHVWTTWVRVIWVPQMLFFVKTHQKRYFLWYVYAIHPTWTTFVTDA